MSILTKPEPQEPTLEQKKEGFKRAVTEFVANSYQQLSAIQRRGLAYVWNGRKLTPYEAAEALGTDAGKLFQFHTILTQAIEDIAAIDGIEANVATPPGEFTIEEDGTLTIVSLPDSE